MGDAEDPTGLGRLGWQRIRLANQVRAPWWYLLGFAGILALMCAIPIGSRYLSWGAGWGWVLAVALFALLQAALGRTSGVAIGTRTLRYRSGRAAGIALIAVIIGADVAETMLVHRDDIGRAIAIGILAVAVAMVCWQAHLRGIRRDLRSGAGPA